MLDIEKYREQLTDAVRHSIEYYYDDILTWCDSPRYEDLNFCVIMDWHVADVMEYDSEESPILFYEVFENLVTEMNLNLK